MSRTYRLVSHVLAFLGVERQDIGIRGDPYLTRWFIVGGLESQGRRVYLHYFHRGDQERALHDHPWAFTSLVIWPGYYE